MRRAFLPGPSIFLTIFLLFLHISLQAQTNGLQGKARPGWTLEADGNHRTLAGRDSVRMGPNQRLVPGYCLIGRENKVSVRHQGIGKKGAWSLYYRNDTGNAWVRFDKPVRSFPDSTLVSWFNIRHNQPLWISFGHEKGGPVHFAHVSVSGLAKDSLLPRYRPDTALTAQRNPNYCSCSNPLDTVPSRDDNLGMGNPSNAAANPGDSNNYLIVKNQYALSYNNSLGLPNWVSWHLSLAWKGSATRCDCFAGDTALPNGYNRVTTTLYTNSGFDRGHLCPSDDRDSTALDNKATFYMTNIAPQAPILNQQTWGDLEDYCRTLIKQGKELYIIAGGYGSGGSGSLGGTTNWIGSNRVAVYSRFWKVVVVLANGKNDASRVDTATRVIAVDMPNQQSVNANGWGYYRTTVDAIEAATGLDILSSVDTAVQAVLESKVDTGPTN